MKPTHRISPHPAGGPAYRPLHRIPRGPSRTCRVTSRQGSEPATPPVSREAPERRGPKSEATFKKKISAGVRLFKLDRKWIRHVILMSPISDKRLLFDVQRFSLTTRRSRIFRGDLAHPQSTRRLSAGPPRRALDHTVRAMDQQARPTRRVMWDARPEPGEPGPRRSSCPWSCGVPPEWCRGPSRGVPPGRGCVRDRAPPPGEWTGTTGAPMCSARPTRPGGS